jgi:hypothetical protein
VEEQEVGPRLASSRAVRNKPSFDRGKPEEGPRRHSEKTVTSMFRQRIPRAGFAALTSAILVAAMARGQPRRAELKAFVLARDGTPAATIVTAATAIEAAAFGAGELQWHVRKITGATLPIKTDDEQVEGPIILIGPSAATARLGLQESQFKDQEYLIRFLDKTLILLGKGQSTAYAVHDFLERCCDVRWYGPGESQMVLPQTATLAVQTDEVRRAPAFAWRE